MTERQVPRMRIYLRNLWQHKSKWLGIPFCDFVISEHSRLWKLIARRHVVVRIGPSSRDVRCVFKRFAVLSQISSWTSYVLLTDNFDFLSNSYSLPTTDVKFILELIAYLLFIKSRRTMDPLKLKYGDQKRLLGKMHQEYAYLVRRLDSQTMPFNRIDHHLENFKLTKHLDVETSVLVGRPSSVLGSVTDVQGKSSFQCVLCRINSDKNLQRKDIPMCISMW